MVDLDNQSSYSEDIYYDYITKITLKNTNEVNKYNNNFYVTYNEETTLQYLYQDAVFTSRKYAEPQITYNINVVDISSLQGFENYKPEIGQRVPIYDNEMNLNGFEGFITSVSKSLESKQNTQVTIATYTNKFEDVFQKLTATMTDVKYNESAIYNAANAITDSGTINGDVFQKSLIDNSYQISLGVNNEITIDKKTGITLVDLDNNTAVKLIGRGVFLTKDYKGDKESLWRTGITGEGINANALITGNIDTKNINIWNATEGQIRFMWNEQGLTAYGATGVVGSSTSSPQNFVDYNKYVRYNYEGLEFVDKTGNITRSALKLGWDGLDIRAQNDSLILNADKGLTIQNSTTTRLHLGKFADNLYGLKLMNNNGNTVFQNDSEGNLWLQQYIKVGGEINNDGSYSTSPNAGIYGIEKASVTTEMMGPRISETTGEPLWDSEPLRFWAGPRDGGTFALEESELYKSFSTEVDKISIDSPVLSRFKVSKSGRIVASGIDVGGWVGGGKFLRSKSNQAVLRSDGYSSVLPVLAIGTTTNSTTNGIDTGQNYNFRVFQDGSLNIGNGQFIATSTGSVTAKALNIVNGSAAGFNISSNEISILSKNKQYKVLLKGSDSNDQVAVISAGTSTTPEFQVFNDGSVIASKLMIGQDQVDSLSTTINNAINSATTASAIFTNAQLSFIGGFTNTTTGTSKGLTASSTNVYYVGIKFPSKSTDIVYYAGTVGAASSSNEFYVKANGELKATSANITGTITANDGKIGGSNGFTITTGKIYSGSKSTSTDTNNGLYLGTDGISLGNNKFKVSSAGYLTATSGTIGGWDIGTGSLYSTSTSADTGYYVGMYKPTTRSSIVFAAGTAANTNAEFYVKADGTVQATKLIIQKINNDYYAGINNPTTSTGVVFYAGNNNSNLSSNAFYVRNDGYMKASSGTIGGWSLTSSRLYTGSSNNRVSIIPKSDSTSTNAVILIGNDSALTANANVNTKFKVSSDGSVYFHGGIYGWSENTQTFRPGLSIGNLYLKTLNDENEISVEINQGLIVDINNV